MSAIVNWGTSHNVQKSSLSNQSYFNAFLLSTPIRQTASINTCNSTTVSIASVVQVYHASASAAIQGLIRFTAWHLFTSMVFKSSLHVPTTTFMRSDAEKSFVIFTNFLNSHPTTTWKSFTCQLESNRSF